MAKKAKLFSLEANLLQNGNVEMQYDSVDPEEFENTMSKGVPDYEGSHSVASLIRYLKSIAEEAMDKSRKYI